MSELPLVPSEEVRPTHGTDAYRRRFRQLVEEHGPPIARALRYMGVSRCDLDDAVQEVFVVAHRRWHELDGEPSIGAWLRGVAVNVARNQRRAARRSPLVLGSAEPAPENPHLAEGHFADRERCHRLLILLDALPEELRIPLVLFEVEAVPMKEIAELLGLSLATTYRRVEDARETLRRALAKEER